jgi:integrase
VRIAAPSTARTTIIKPSPPSPFCFLAIACGERSIPIGPNVVKTLREWKLVCPKGDLDLVFPNNRGKLWDHVHIVENFLQPTLVRAGIVDANGKAKYPGLHALRHMGHASITITSDVYGHLFPRTDDGKEMAEAEKMLFAVN